MMTKMLAKAATRLAVSTFLVGLFFVTAKPALAIEDCTNSAISARYSQSTNFPSSYTAGADMSGTYIRFTGLSEGDNWGIRIFERNTAGDTAHRHIPFTIGPDREVSIEDLYALHPGFFDNIDNDDSNMRLDLYRDGGDDWENPDFSCRIKDFVIKNQLENLSCSIDVMSTDSNGVWGRGCIQRGRPIQFTINQWVEGPTGTKVITNQNLQFARMTEGGNRQADCPLNSFSSGSITVSMSPGDGICGSIDYIDEEGNYDFAVRSGEAINAEDLCTKQITIFDECTDEEVAEEVPVSAGTIEYDLCTQLPEGSPAISTCQACYSQGGIYTAIGCIPYGDNGVGAVRALIVVGLNISGGVAILIILVAGFKFSTSQGDPKKVGDAKEMMTSGIVGIIFVIFSVSILQFVGVTILRIPGFGGS